MKRPEEAEQKNDPKYCKYHRLVGHTIQDYFIFNDKVMQTKGFNQGGQRVVDIIRMQLTMEDMVSTALVHVIDAKTSNNLLPSRPYFHENALVPSTWHQYFKYYHNSIVKKVLSDNKSFTKVESHFTDAKYYIEDINLKQLSKLPLKGFVPSTQEEEGRYEALAIEEK
ncbi:UNVERIFIED_CONTAM: hypothetical protein Scaly_2612700 [Sesamum calycinum]|uniref:Uncharacterized protein n=1 Tax=Sesamum calycinum TaxID=2727403 RepID=A0AAW2JC48_9LAMI